ncbi:MAG: hypothetical protein GX308_06495 [Epulopiscium sp.]|nr:hypothetical protein [Candidatus Epulonipiscium sp.]
MKAIVFKNQFTCVGKIDEIISYLTELELQYKTIQEYIDDKQRPLNKKSSH